MAGSAIDPCTVGPLRLVGRRWLLAGNEIDFVTCAGKFVCYAVDLFYTIVEIGERWSARNERQAIEPFLTR